MFLLILSILFSQVSDVNLFLSQKSVSIKEFKKYIQLEEFEHEEPSDNIFTFLSTEIYPHSNKYKLSQPLTFTKVIENNIQLSFSVYYDTNDQTVKYYKLTVDKMKPEIDQLMKKYLTTTSDVQLAAKLAVKELETYRLSKFELEYLSNEFEEIITKKYGVPVIKNANSKKWNNEFSTIDLQIRENYLNLTVYWE